MDVFDRAKRSQVMSRIRSEGTLAEQTLYALVRELLGVRRRIDRNVNSLPGRPDLFIPSLKVAIFAHGCFYHGCAKHGRVPKSNQDYWAPKLIGNRRRDGRDRRLLRRLGFSVWTIWEHALEGRAIERTRATLTRRLEARIRSKDLQYGR